MEIILKFDTEDNIKEPSVENGMEFDVSKELKRQGLNFKSIVDDLKDIANEPSMRKTHIELIARKLWEVSVKAEEYKKLRYKLK